MWYVHDKTGELPMLIFYVFVYSTPFLMWSIPVMFAIVGGRSWAKKYSSGTSAVRFSMGLVGGILHFVLGAAIIFIVFEMVDFCRRFIPTQ